MIKKLINTACLFALLSFPVCAQEYDWSVTLDSVRQDGFYKLVLTPTITEKIQTSYYSDLRMLDQGKKEVPYVLQEEWNNDKRWLQEYAVLSKEIKPERYTRIVIHNPKKNSIDNFSLVVKNNNAYKTAKLSGSDDQENWFFITENYPLSLMQDQRGVVSDKRIDFPLSNYEFYKLEVNDSASAPLNILQIGYYATSVATAKQMQLPLPEVSQSDSIKSKQTFVAFHFKNSFHIHALNFSIEGPKFYKRKARLYKVYRMNNGTTELSEQYSFELSSDGLQTLVTPELSGKDFLMVIDNGDNAALQVKKIQAFQRTRYLVAYLKASDHYTLALGNKKAELPVYDLGSFTDSIPQAVPEIYPVKFEWMRKEETKAVAEEVWFRSKLWIWGALVVVLALLGLISYRMIKDMENKDK